MPSTSSVPSWSIRSGSLVPEMIVATWPAASLSFTRLGRIFTRFSLRWRARPGLQGELGLAVDVDEHRVRDVADVERLHVGELGRERFPGERVVLRPLEPHGNGVP